MSTPNIFFSFRFFIDPSNELALYNLGNILKGFRTPFPDPELINLIVMRNIATQHGVIATDIVHQHLTNRRTITSLINYV